MKHPDVTQVLYPFRRPVEPIALSSTECVSFSFPIPFLIPLSLPRHALQTPGFPETEAFFDVTGGLTICKGPSRSGCGEVTPEQWRHWGGMERQMAMIKVVRALQREDPAGIFSRTLDPDTLRVRDQSLVYILLSASTAL